MMNVQIVVLNPVNLRNSHNVELPINENSKFDQQHFKCARCKTFYRYFCATCNMLAMVCVQSSQMESRNLINVVHTDTKTVIALHDFAVNTRFGPCKGHKRLEENGKYTWKIYLNRSYESSERNWLHLVRTVTDINAANLVAFQSKGELYFITIREIYEGQEFGLFWPYSENRVIELDDFTCHTPEVINFNREIWCDICNFNFSSENYQVMHNTHYHSIEELEPDFLKCPHCCGNFMTYNFDKHNSGDCAKNKATRKRFRKIFEKQKLEVKEFVCDGCRQHYRDEAYFYKHKRRCPQLEENKIKSYVCEVCQFRFRFRMNLMVHLTRKHPEYEKLKCQYCSFRATKIWHLDYHNKTLHREFYEGRKIMESEILRKPNARDEKNESKELLTDLSEFLTINSKPKKKEFHCQLCGGAFPRRVELIIHQHTKHFRRKRECHECGMFTPNGTLLQHIKIAHNDDKEKLYSCGDCDYASRNLENIRKHLKTHERDESITTISCAVRYVSCDRQIKNPKKKPGAHGTRKTESAPVDSKNYLCKNCGVSLQNLRSLLYHVRDHDETIASAN